MQRHNLATGQYLGQPVQSTRPDISHGIIECVVHGILSTCVYDTHFRTQTVSNHKLGGHLQLLEI